MKLYTRTVCPRCMWVKSEIQRANIEVDIINIDRDEEARDRLINAGIKSVPVLEVDGTYIWEPEDMIQQLERMKG